MLLKLIYKLLHKGDGAVCMGVPGNVYPKTNANSWKYYNYAAIPTGAPHEQIDITPIEDGSIWRSGFLFNGGGKAPLLARYVETFDQKEETGFWYIIKDGPFVFENLSKKYQKHILKALERCEAKRINPVEYKDDIYAVYKAAYTEYKTADNEMPEEVFKEYIQHDDSEYWGAFSRETGEMAGWMSCRNHGDWTATVSAKYHPELQSYNRPSDVIHYAVLQHYLNELGQRYICSGSRNLNHKTNVQDYKEKNWQFRRAYCRLKVVYNPKISWLIKCLYHFRQFLLMLDNVTIIHQLNSLLRMEEIVRNDSKLNVASKKTTVD